MQIAAGPAGASLDEFDWRVSLARIDTNGPFSSFPGVDRVLSVVGGGPLVVQIEGRHLTLDRNSPPIEFAGEEEVRVELPTGPVTDINVMVRRDRYIGNLRRELIEEPRSIDCHDGIMVLIVLSPAGVGYQGRRENLVGMDAFMLRAGEFATLYPSMNCTSALIARIEPSKGTWTAQLSTL